VIDSKMSAGRNIMTTDQNIMFSPPQDDDSLAIASAATFTAGSTITITFSSAFVQGLAHATTGIFAAPEFSAVPHEAAATCTGSNTIKYKMAFQSTQSITWTAPAEVDSMSSVTLSFAAAAGMGTVSRKTLILTRDMQIPECVGHDILKCINDASSFWPRCDPSQSKLDNFPDLHGRTPDDYGHFCTQSWVDGLNTMLAHPAINKCTDREAHIKLLAQIAVETGYFSTLFQPADGGAGLVHMIPANWPINAQDMEDFFWWRLCRTSGSSRRILF
jgi:hypothetical protein